MERRYPFVDILAVSFQTQTQVGIF